MAGADQISVVFSALADPTRRAILDELAERDATVTELSSPLPMSMPSVSRHLNVLEPALSARERDRASGVPATSRPPRFVSRRLDRSLQTVPGLDPSTASMPTSRWSTVQTAERTDNRKRQ